MTATDPRIADLYDVDNPDGPDHDFFRALAERLGARAILDLGCGTGLLTVTLAGGGRVVVGVDPSATMLAIARARRGGERVTWIEGDSTAAPPGPFDLALMTGNVAQHIPNGDWMRTLRDLRGRLRDGAALAFESRNPADRPWETWATEAPTTRDSPHGPLTEWMDIERLDARLVRMRAHTRFERTGELVTETQDLVFRDRVELERDLDAAGYDVELVAGDWAGTPFQGDERVMIVVARAR